MKEGLFLYNAEDKPLQDFLENLSEDEIASCCEYKIFLCAVEYYDNHLVKNAALRPGGNLVTAAVKGSEKYDVEIFKQNDEILGSCVLFLPFSVL